MITVSEAKAAISEHIISLAPVKLSLKEASMYVLAEDIFATIDIPAFEQSSMDGYAIRYEDRNIPLVVCGEMAAGTTKSFIIHQGETARIFTGAPLPVGADAVVMQEKVLIENDKIVINDKQIKQGSNVRNKGAEAKAGSLAMQHGCLLSPAAIGFLAGIGVTNVLVYPMPSISIIITGKELQTPGADLLPGQVYESNSYSLTAALQHAGIKNIAVFQADDDLIILKNILEKALNRSDVVLLTGGVSVGDYDFVLEAANLCHVKQVFHKVKQKPGKPLYFGLQHAKLIFGLPGNPSSVLSCFYNYVLPAIEMLSKKQSSTRYVSAKLTKDYVKGLGLTHFLKGSYQNGTATPLGAQESFRLSSFAQANCLICLEEHREEYKTGETVEVILLPC